MCSRVTGNYNCAIIHSFTANIMSLAVDETLMRHDFCFTHNHLLTPGNYVNDWKKSCWLVGVVLYTAILLFLCYMEWTSE